MRKPAFTFVELLIALSLFAVGMLSVIQIFPVNRRYLAQSAYTTQASFVAQEKIEEVRNTPYINLTTGSAPAYEVRHAVSAVAGDQLSQFERQTVVEYVNPNAAGYPVDGTDKGLKKVTVTVYWSERAINRQYSLTTYVSYR